MSHFISVSEISQLLESDATVRLLDVRWSLARPNDGKSDYLAGHLPGAVFVDLSHELSDHDKPGQGRHPVPSIEALERDARGWGLNDGDTVVAYDESTGVPAARAWWLLRRAGLDIRVLEGGYRAWVDAGLEVQTGEVQPAPGNITLSETRNDEISIDEAAAFADSGILIDVRAPERYRGEVEPIDPIAGHIPGAINIPTTNHLTDDGMLRDPDELRAQLRAAGVVPGIPVAAYCGSGVTAAHTALVLAELGIDAKVFPGSWSQWSNTEGRPIATGPNPHGD